ncbi:MAG: hypothetical protein IT509_04080 [Rhodocyclaceae bacterium]|nr:hypothetical protein [Rhodocyclaceae bacterium]
MRLVVDVSAHGYGHFGQTAPVLNALVQRMPDLELVLRSGLPASLLAQRLEGRFGHVPCSLDIGMLMADALHVDVPASLAAYRVFHDDWDRRVDAEAVRLAELEPDLLLANVPYLSLSAARRAGVPSVALCSLNWADVVRHYFGRDAEVDRIVAHIASAYDAAMLFLRPEPAMPMADLANTVRLGPIAQRAQSRRDELVELIGLRPGERVALVSMGGVPQWLPPDAWSQASAWRFLVREDARPGGQAVDLRALPFSHLELLASVDALVTKPGYGSFVEAAVHGVPVLYLRRDDWPEEQALVQWLTTMANCAELSWRDLECGRVSARLDQLVERSPRPLVVPTGNEEAARTLAGLLKIRCLSQAEQAAA